MSIISNIFSNLKQSGQKAFIPFITVGDGGMDNSEKAMFALVQNGAEIIELGMPFSDPMADGPVITKSHERAVADGINLHNVFGLVERFRKNNNKAGIVLMGYTNPVEMFGYKAFAERAQEAGVNGVLLVDMPPEEAQYLKSELDTVDIDLIFLVSPTTTDERLKMIAQVASGFVYFVSLKGVTGADSLNVESVNRHLSRIRKFIDLPVGVGFGIKDAETAKKVSEYAEAVIIGSSIVSIIEQLKDDGDKMATKIGNFTHQIVNAIKKD